MHIPEVRRAAGRLAYQEGFGSFRPEKRPSRWALRPILNYDININNSFASEAIHLGGLDFVVDEKFRRQSAPVIGASLAGSHLWGLSRKLSFSFDHTSRYVHAWNANFDKWSFVIRPCITRFLSGTERAFACASAETAVAELSRKDERSIIFGAESAYVFSSYFQSSRISIERAKIDDGVKYFQNSVSYRHETLLGNATLVGVQAKIYQSVDRTFASRESFSIFGSKVFEGRLFEIGYIQENRRGGTFLGEARKERLQGIVLSARVTDTLSVRVGRFRNRASNEFNEDQFAIFDLNFDLLAGR